MRLGMLFWAKTPEDLKGRGMRQRTRKYIKEHGSGCGAQYTLTSESRTYVTPEDYIQYGCRFRRKLRFKDLAMEETDWKDNLSNTARNILMATVLLVSVSLCISWVYCATYPNTAAGSPAFRQCALVFGYCLLYYYSVHTGNVWQLP